MNLPFFKKLSLINDALSPAYRDYLYPISESVSVKNATITMNSYSAFIFITEDSHFTGLNILSDSNAIDHHLKTLIGFIYCSNGITMCTKRNHCSHINKIFMRIAREKNLVLTPLALSVNKLTDDVISSISEFKRLSIKGDKLEYLNGWQVQSKEGKSIELNLDNIYVNYGREFANRVHKAIENYAFTQSSITLTNRLYAFHSLFFGFTEVCKSKDELMHNLSSTHVNKFFLAVMNLRFAQSQLEQHDPKTFFRTWALSVKVYLDCFVQPNVFDAPIKIIVTPTFKTPTDKSPVFSIGGKPSTKEEDRWFSSIPLHIKDDEAIDIISVRLNRDLAHIRHVCEAKFEEIKQLQIRNTEFIKNGSIKPLTNKAGNRDFDLFMGQDKLANTVATFYRHGINAKSNYIHFLGYHSKADELTTELNLPTLATIQALVTLLILEHPLITPSWLQKWELFGKSGDKVGFKQVNSQWVAVSFKSRKGANNAQQVVVLNNYSKAIVECLIEHTSFARSCLKKQNHKHYSRMIMTATPNKTHIHTDLNGSMHSGTRFNDWLCDEKYLNASMNTSRSMEDAQSLSELFTLRSIRRHRALQIYLETRSMQAVSEALGHKDVDIVMLTSYLPKPLMDFFNARWIRQFQNAILLEAMKDSQYCFDAVDISADDIDDFLKNHGISDIPSHLDHGFKSTAKVESSPLFDEMTFTISTALLQMLIAIRSIVEKEDEEIMFKDVVNNWYQSAIFILTVLGQRYSNDEELMLMLEDAESNTLNTENIRGALLW